jgi:hypothetical protein
MIGGGGALAFFASDIKEHFQKQQQQQRRPPQGRQSSSDQDRRQEQQQNDQRQRRRVEKDADVDSPYRQPESPRSGSSANSAQDASFYDGAGEVHASPFATAELVPQLSAETIDSIVESVSYVLIFVTNAGVADRGTMHSLARHFHEVTSSEKEFRQWSTVLLDYDKAVSAQAAQPPRMGALLPMVRSSPVCVLRKGARLATFEGKPSVRRVEDWVGALQMGEVSWSSVESGPLGGS